MKEGRIDFVYTNDSFICENCGHEDKEVYLWSDGTASHQNKSECIKALKRKHAMLVRPPIPGA